MRRTLLIGMGLAAMTGVAGCGGSQIDPAQAAEPEERISYADALQTLQNERAELVRLQTQELLLRRQVEHEVADTALGFVAGLKGVKKSSVMEWSKLHLAYLEKELEQLQDSGGGEESIQEKEEEIRWTRKIIAEARQQVKPLLAEAGQLLKQITQQQKRVERAESLRDQLSP